MTFLKTNQIQADQKEIQKIVQKSGSSFYWGMRVLPSMQRNAMYAVYAFCRILDDIADGDADKIILSEFSSDTSISYRSLDFWKQEINNLFIAGEAKTSIGRQLLIAIKQYNIYQDDLLDLIRGMEMDIDGPIYAPTWPQLDLYCARVAGAVGQVSVKIFGIEDIVGRHLAYHLGRALQFTNILRDIAEDWLISRLYLPQELLIKYQINPRNSHSPILQHPNFSKICNEIYELAAFHFDCTQKLMQKCSKQQQKPMKLMAVIYKKLLLRMKNKNWQNMHHKIRLGKFEKISVMLGQLV